MYGKKRITDLIAAVKKVRDTLTQTQIQQIGEGYNAACSKLTLAENKAARWANNWGEIRGLLLDARALFNNEANTKIKRAQILLTHANLLQKELSGQRMEKLGENRLAIASNKLARATEMLAQTDKSSTLNQIVGLIEDSIALFGGSKNWSKKTFEDLRREARQRRRQKNDGDDDDGEFGDYDGDEYNDEDLDNDDEYDDDVDGDNDDDDY